MAEQILEIIDDEVLLRKKALSGRKWVMDTFPTVSYTHLDVYKRQYQAR